MKVNKLILILCMAGVFYLLPTEAFSQKKAGGPPPWAPAHGYRAKTRHIYFPDHNFYFDIQRGVYIFMEGGKWSIAARLPGLFGNINLSASTQVELDISTSEPQAYNARHLTEYKIKHGSGHKKDKKNHPGKGKGRS